MANWVKALLFSLAFEALLFGGAIIREVQADQRPLRAAIGTALVVVGMVAPLLGIGIYIQWRDDRRQEARRREGPFTL